MIIHTLFPFVNNETGPQVTFKVRVRLFVDSQELTAIGCIPARLSAALKEPQTMTESGCLTFLIMQQGLHVYWSA